jgi:hypothetical protein
LIGVLETKVKKREMQDIDEQSSKMQVLDYGSPTAHSQTQSSKRPTLQSAQLLDQSQTQNEEEGEIHKQILLSIGSMA